MDDEDSICQMAYLFFFPSERRYSVIFSYSSLWPKTLKNEEKVKLSPGSVVSLGLGSESYEATLVASGKY